MALATTLRNPRMDARFLRTILYNVQEFPQRPNHMHYPLVAGTLCCTKPLRGGFLKHKYTLRHDIILLLTQLNWKG